jgi:hypothetical protein
MKHHEPRRRFAARPGLTYACDDNPSCHNAEGAVDVFKAAGAFIGIVVAGLLWNQFAVDTGEDMKKDMEAARKQWERNPTYATKPISPLDTATAPGWTPPRPVPPAVNMPSSGKK